MDQRSLEKNIIFPSLMGKDGSMGDSASKVIETLLRNKCMVKKNVFCYDGVISSDGSRKSFKLPMTREAL